MKIKTPHQLPEGEHLTFKLLLVNGSISLKGKIIYSRFLPGNESVSGVQFMGLSARAQSLLKDCLDNLEGQRDSFFSVISGHLVEQSTPFGEIQWISQPNEYVSRGRNSESSNFPIFDKPKTNLMS